jgi:hypothetical protein
VYDYFLFIDDDVGKIKCKNSEEIGQPQNLFKIKNILAKITP